MIHDDGDGLHSFGVRSLPAVFASGKESDVELVEMTASDGSIDEVTERARACIGDHIVDIRVLLQIREHAPEHGALFDGLGGDSRLDEFLDDLGLKRIGLLLTDVTLGGDRIAVLVDVRRGLSLTLTGYT